MKQNRNVAEIQVTYKPTDAPKPIVKSSKQAFDELIKFFPDETIALQEQFMAMYINRGNKVLGVYNMAKGGLSSTVVDLRLLLSVALKIAATGIILCHNHPSGNLQPSTQDKSLTRQIIEACKFHDLSVLDHIIIASDKQYFSFADEGEM